MATSLEIVDLEGKLTPSPYTTNNHVFSMPRQPYMHKGDDGTKRRSDHIMDIIFLYPPGKVTLRVVRTQFLFLYALLHVYFPMTFHVM